MLIAIVNGQKQKPSPDTKGECPHCRRPVFSKCGVVKRWHWSHYADACSAAGGGVESDWHYDWKNLFAPNEIEVSSARWPNNRADVCFDSEIGKIIVEFQHSPISRKAIEQRELAYGENLVWVFDFETRNQDWKKCKRLHLFSMEPGNLIGSTIVNGTIKEQIVLSLKEHLRSEKLLREVAHQFTRTNASLIGEHT